MIMISAVAIICLSGCSKDNTNDERITYLLNDSGIVYDNSREGYNQLLELKVECGSVLTDPAYSFKSKQSELISELDSVVEKYQKKRLAGDLILYTTYSDSPEQTVIKTWTLKPNGIVIDFED